MFSLKNSIILVVTLTLVALVTTSLYMAKSSGGAKIATRVMEKQGEANEEENKRAMEAVSAGQTILTESNDAFLSRLQLFRSSTGLSSNRQTKSLQDIRLSSPRDTGLGFLAFSEAEVSEALQALGVLQQEDPGLLPCKGRIVIYDLIDYKSSATCVELEETKE